MLYRSFLNWPINRKLSAIVLLISGLLIGTMGFAVTIEKYMSFRSKVEMSTTTLAQIIGTNCTAALAFQDPVTANEILSALKAEETIISASLFNQDGELFARYSNLSYFQNWIDTSSPHPVEEELRKRLRDTETKLFVKNHFDLTMPIFLNDKIIGHIAFRSSLDSLNRQLHVFILIISLLSLALFALGLFICSRLNKTIVGPITDLAESMEQITKHRKFDIRVTKQRNDELGVLIDGFNEMLEHIQKRDLEIARHGKRLAGLVDKRTRELQLSNEQLLLEIEDRKAVQNQLAHAQKMEAIGTLAGGVAHDLNNILSGVVSYPDLLLLNLPADSKMRKPLETIQASGKKAAAIVQDLLTLARRGVKIEEKVDMYRLVLEYIDSPECNELLRFHPKVNIIPPVGGHTSPILGSPVHLSKTIMNLVSNAAEAMPDGGDITIELDQVLLDTQPVGFGTWQAGYYIRLAISDTGIGIPQQFIDRIFEPFYSRKVMGRSGTGLGMAVVWGTMEDHLGHITVASEEGKGTTFQIFLPTLDKSFPSSLGSQANLPEYGSGQTILVVDDIEEQRQIASEILTHLGYKTVCVPSGGKAVEYLRHNQADLVILDMLMPPGIDGLETYKQILAFQSEQKAIIASGYSQAEKIHEAQQLGVLEFVRKPYTLLNISRTVASALAQ